MPEVPKVPRVTHNILDIFSSTLSTPNSKIQTSNFTIRYRVSSELFCSVEEIPAGNIVF